jgi:hypothetical protein
MQVKNSYATRCLWLWNRHAYMTRNDIPMILKPRSLKERVKVRR